MLSVSLIKSRSPRLIPLKRLFADFDKPNPSLTRLSITKRLRIKTKEAEQEAKVY
jgi:hypothetical protein